jgi:excisionase family DNA binding protein
MNGLSSIPNADVEPALLRVAEVARIIGFGRSKTYEMIRAGELPSIDIDGNIRVPRKALQDWLDQKINSAGPKSENAMPPAKPLDGGVVSQKPQLNARAGSTVRTRHRNPLKKSVI